MNKKDYTDDWMNPQTETSWVEKQPKYPEYIIERAKREICLGNPGHSIVWKHWQSFSNKKERDDEYERLREEHPAWRLRKRVIHEYNTPFGDVEIESILDVFKES